jgi:hypothetical protein
MTKLIAIILVQLIKMVPYVYLFFSLPDYSYLSQSQMLCLKTDHLTIIYVHKYMCMQWNYMLYLNIKVCYAYLYRRVLYRLYNKFVHKTHQYIPQGCDPFGSKTSRLDVCRHVAMCILNQDI